MTKMLDRFVALLPCVNALRLSQAMTRKLLRRHSFTAPVIADT
jgi:hypothetical protein